MKLGKAAGIAYLLLCVAATQGCVGLAVTGTAAAVQDRRTPGAYIDDELIELRVRIAITEDKALTSQTHINATSVNGLVLLTGEAPGESLRTRVTDIARGMPRVRSVQNEVALKAPSTLLARTNDTIVTGKVKTALLGDGRLNPTQIKVVTERGVVYLMGLLKQDEADRATDIARRVPGVKRVVKVIEYIQ